MAKVNLKKITDSFSVEKNYFKRTEYKELRDYRVIFIRQNIQEISIDIPFLLRGKLQKKEVLFPREKTTFFSHFPFVVFSDTALYFEYMAKETVFDFEFFYTLINIKNGQITFLLTFFVALKGFIK